MKNVPFSFIYTVPYHSSGLKALYCNIKAFNNIEKNPHYEQAVGMKNPGAGVGGGLRELCQKIV